MPCWEITVECTYIVCFFLLHCVNYLSNNSYKYILIILNLLKLPSVELHSGFPPEKIDLKEYTSNKSVLLVGLPGAFTPT